MFSSLSTFRPLLCGCLALLACGETPFVAGDPEPATAPAAGKADTPVFAPGDAVEVCNVNSGLNLRAGPSTAHQVLVVLLPGDRGQVLDRDRGWYHLEVASQRGWAHGGYLCGAGTTDPGDEPPGALLGTVWNTYYHLAEEALHPTSDSGEAVLFDGACQPLARVSAAFSDAVCVEGSGRLADGTVISFARTCRCGRRCPTGGTVCYEALSSLDYPWGRGSGGRALAPLRSLAVDSSLLSLGSTIYLAEWDGFEVPRMGALGGFVHDGCFRADDVGGWVEGNHVDLFSGTQAMRLALERDRPTNSSWTARRGGQRCAHLER